MNIIFFGSSHFAVPSLKAILGAGHTVSCVVTQPDRRKGRGLHLEGTPVKAAALESGLELYQPAVLNAPGPLEELRKFNPDVFVVIAYGQILSADLLKIPVLGSLNAHASLLPRYRGAAPINWAIINAEKDTGVSIIRMNEKMDAGPVILQESCCITDLDTAVTLEHSLSELAAPMVLKTLDCLSRHACRPVPQDERRVTFAPKLRKETGLIHWDKSAVLIHNLVRGCLDWPGAFTYYRGKLLKISRASVAEVAQAEREAGPGTIIAAAGGHILAACGEGALQLETLQLEGGRSMDARLFISGHKISAGEKLG